MRSCCHRRTWIGSTRSRGVGASLPAGAQAGSTAAVRGAGAAALKKDGTFKYWQSMLRYPCGSLQLWNYPVSMRDVPVTDQAGAIREDAGHVDLAAIDIFRDRERGVPRFNDFRRRCAPSHATCRCRPPRHTAVLARESRLEGCVRSTVPSGVPGLTQCLARPPRPSSRLSSSSCAL